MYICTPVLQENQAGITLCLLKDRDWPGAMSISLSLISLTLVSQDVSAVVDVLMLALSDWGYRNYPGIEQVVMFVMILYN